MFALDKVYYLIPSAVQNMFIRGWQYFDEILKQRKEGEKMGKMEEKNTK